jgi:TPR repeat protein
MNTHKLAALTALVFGLWAPAPHALADLASGIAAYQQGKWGVALKDLTPDAENGNAEAQLYLGRIYANYKDAPQDTVAAFKWYQLAAQQGNHTAEEILGSAYLNGEGVAKDFNAALKWLRLSAEHRNALAVDGLGLAYQNGWGVKRDKVLALALYNLANFNNDFSLNKGISKGFLLAKDLKEVEVKSAWNLFCVLGRAQSITTALDAYVANPKNTPANACSPSPAQ